MVDFTGGFQQALGDPFAGMNAPPPVQGAPPDALMQLLTQALAANPQLMQQLMGGGLEQGPPAATVPISPVPVDPAKAAVAALANASQMAAFNRPGIDPALAPPAPQGLPTMAPPGLGLDRARMFPQPAVPQVLPDQLRLPRGLEPNRPGY